MLAQLSSASLLLLPAAMAGADLAHVGLGRQDALVGHVYISKESGSEWSEILQDFGDENVTSSKEIMIKTVYIAGDKEKIILYLFVILQNREIYFFNLITMVGRNSKKRQKIIEIELSIPRFHITIF